MSVVRVERMKKNAQKMIIDQETRNAGDGTSKWLRVSYLKTIPTIRIIHINGTMWDRDITTGRAMLYRGKNKRVTIDNLETALCVVLEEPILKKKKTRKQRNTISRISNEKTRATFPTM